MLSKDKFWEIASSLPAEDVEVFDSSGNVAGIIRMRGLSTAELTSYQESLVITLSSGQRKTNTKRAMSKLIALCAINEDGSPLFSKEDIARLDEAPVRMIMPLFESAQRLCGLSEDDVRQMVGDFEKDQSTD